MAFAADKAPLEDSDDLIQKIQTHTLAHLAQLPRYTCHEVINRFVRRGTLTRQDTVELEVAIIDHEELFARAGSDRFEERVIDRLVPNGTVGNGAFGTHLEVLFARGVANFKFMGAAKKDGHRTFRLNFVVPLERSRFLVKHSGMQATVPYEGSVWVDAVTLDLVRVEVHVNHIGPQLGLRSIEEIMHYGVMHIGNSDALLPHKSELAVNELTGNGSVNLVELQACREFQSDSIVKYAVPNQRSAAGEGQQP